MIYFLLTGYSALGHWRKWRRRDGRRDFFTTLPFFLLLLGEVELLLGFRDLALTSSALENFVFVSGVRVGVMVITLWRWI